MTGAAYAYAEAAPPAPSMPNELVLLGYIDRFGVEAVMGRPVLSAGEIRKMLIAEDVVYAYGRRKASGNWGQWSQDHPYLDALLKSIEVNNERS